MDSQRRRDARADLKATSEDLAADARRVANIEELKASLDPMDPRMKPLAQEGETLTAEMATKAEMETQLVHEASAEARN
jgi:hypothetical protein